LGRGAKDRGQCGEAARLVEQTADIADQRMVPTNRQNIGTKSRHSRIVELGPIGALLRVEFCYFDDPSAMPCPLGNSRGLCRCPCVFNNKCR
jgi:hypothetical protein